MTLPTMLTESDLPLAELTALMLDGELYRLDTGYSPVDQPDFPSVRAATLACRWPHRLIVEQHSAAWVHGALERPPARHELCADTGARARPTNLRAASVREVVISADEVQGMGGIDVTTPVRTVCDLARFSAFDDTDRRTCARLLRIGGTDVDECLRIVQSRPKLMHKQRTIARLRAIGDYPDETR